MERIEGHPLTIELASHLTFPGHVDEGEFVDVVPAEVVVILSIGKVRVRRVRVCLWLGLYISDQGYPPPTHHKPPFISRTRAVVVGARVVLIPALRTRRGVHVAALARLVGRRPLGVDHGARLRTLQREGVPRGDEGAVDAREACLERHTRSHHGLAGIRVLVVVIDVVVVLIGAAVAMHGKIRGAAERDGRGHRRGRLGCSVECRGDLMDLRIYRCVLASVDSIDQSITYHHPRGLISAGGGEQGAAEQEEEEEREARHGVGAWIVGR